MSRVQVQGERSPSSMSQASAVLEWDPSADVGTVPSATPRERGGNDLSKADFSKGSTSGSRGGAELKYSPVSDSVWKLKSDGDSGETHHSVGKSKIKSSSSKSSSTETSEEPTTKKMSSSDWRDECRAHIETYQRERQSGSSESLLSTTSIGYKKIDSSLSNKSSSDTSKLPSTSSSSTPKRSAKRKERKFRKSAKKRNESKEESKRLRKVPMHVIALIEELAYHRCLVEAMVESKIKRLIQESRALRRAGKDQKPSEDWTVYDDWLDYYNEGLRAELGDSFMKLRPRFMYLQRYNKYATTSSEFSSKSEEMTSKPKRTERKKRVMCSDCSTKNKELFEVISSQEFHKLKETLRIQKEEKRALKRALAQADQEQTKQNIVETPTETSPAVEKNQTLPPVRKNPVKFFVNLDSDAEGLCSGMSDLKIQSVQEQFVAGNPNAYSTVKARDDALLEVKQERKMATEKFCNMLDKELQKDNDQLDIIIQKVSSETASKISERVIPVEEMLERTEKLLKTHMKAKRERKCYTEKIMTKVNYIRKKEYAAQLQQHNREQSPTHKTSQW